MHRVRKLTTRFMRLAFCIVLAGCGTDAVAQSIDPVLSWRQAEENAYIYAAEGALPPANLERVRVGMYDARHEKDDAPLLYLRRYVDDAAGIHPSVLASHRLPSHIVVVATCDAEVREAMDEIAKYPHHASTSFVLLFGGDFEELDDAYGKTFGVIAGSHGEREYRLDVASQALFGGIEVASDVDRFFVGDLTTQVQHKVRLGYSPAEMSGMDSKTLENIDDVCAKMISDKASPGAYVLIARKGRVVFSKGYGHTLYKGGDKITDDNLYDLASVSKAIGTTPVVMKLFDEKRMRSDATIGDYLTEVDTAKAAITVASLLQHDSGLPSGISSLLFCIDSASFEPPLYRRTRKGDYTIKIDRGLYMTDKVKLKSDAFAQVQDARHPVQVGISLFETDSFRLHILDAIDNVNMLTKRYRYSDLNFIYLQQIVERVTDRPLDMLFDRYIARPMGLRRLLYRPMTRYDRNVIVPTEDDVYFRRELVWGVVHDPTAALLGGVAGNAGLFGNANEVAKIAQMYLWKGEYGGMKIVMPATVDDFNSRHAKGNRRGYGFDKPALEGDGPVSKRASDNSFGHSGFSGTYFWVDPDEELIYIFLSNRIHPDATNTKLTTTDVRQKIHEIAYKAIVRSE